MDSNSKLSEFSDEIPFEIKSLLKGLSADDRLGILIALMRNGKMTFNEMKEKFDLHSSSLSNHLTALQDGSLVENFYEKGDEKGFSYYQVTDIPEAVFESLFDIMYKPNAEPEEYTTEFAPEESSEKNIVAGSSPSFEKDRVWSRSLRVSRKHTHRQRLATIDSDSSERFDVTGS